MGNMARSTDHKWIFRARFKLHAFGWRSQPAIKRIKEAMSEIKKATNKDPLLVVEGAVLFLKKYFRQLSKLTAHRAPLAQP